MSGRPVDLATMTTGARAVWAEAYESGYVDGFAAGHLHSDEEWAGSHEVSAAIARQIAQHGPYDELEERRGRPERAAAHRRLMVERGIA